VNDTLKWAKTYLAAGLSLIPIARFDTRHDKCPDSKLLPESEEMDERGHFQRTWKPYQERLPTVAELCRWFGSAQPPGIAIICGRVSGNLELLDFDQDAHELFGTWSRLVAEQCPGLVERLSVVKTPRAGGGYHVRYRCPQVTIPGNTKLASDPELPRGQRTLIETRGEKGYALAPGSPPECHETGGTYEWVAGPPLAEIQPISAEEREVLWCCARMLSRETAMPTPAQGGAEAQRVGDVYDQRGPDWAEILGAHGWTLASGGQGGERRWRRPGKAHGWSATTGHCHAADGADLLRVFSSNAEPFECKAYGKFRACALLNFHGDCKAAARELARQGYRPAGPAGAAAPAPAAAPLPATASASWPEPPNPAAFYGLAGDVVWTIEPETEADSLAVLAQFLVAYGSACGRWAFRPVGPRRHYANLYLVLVGPTSSGRKGTSWSWIEALFAGVDPTWSDLCVQSGLSSGEGLIAAVRDAVRRVENDQEILVQDGAKDKRLLVIEEEFGATLRVAQRDGSILSHVLRQAWDSGRLRTLTRNHPLKATGAHISVIGHVTREELRHALGDTESANGFANRFLWIAVRRSKFLPDGGELLNLAPLQERLRVALDHARLTGLVKRDQAARKLWHREYERLSSPPPGRLGQVTTRAPAQVLRLSLLYALLDLEDTICRPHLEAALALWDYCQRSAAWVFGDSTGSADADEILDALRANPEGLNRTQLNDLFHGHRSSRQIAEALAVLQESGLIRSQKTPTEGRPTEKWVLAAE